MKQKLFRSLLLLTCLSVMVTAALFAWFSYQQINKDIFDDLKREAQLLGSQKARGRLDLEHLTTLQLQDRITIIGADGTPLYDNYADEAKMENHLQREEVQQALQQGEGYAHRTSGTLGEQVLYYAVALPDGSVLRLSQTNEAAFEQFAIMLRTLLLILASVLIMAFFVARSLTKKVLRPLVTLDPYAPGEDIYPELVPIVRSFSQQQRQLEYEMERYKAKKQELKAVTNNMGEGLLLLDNDGRIITLNKSAVKFFGQAKQALLEHNLREFNLEQEFRQLLEQIDSAGNGKGSLLLDRGSSCYQLNATRVAEREVVLLIMDITERMASEKLRREFSANVSHELKTPLQSVLGYSEIMLSGLVREEDRPRFLQKIYDEAKNLLHLIDDIIKLSRLDELKQEMLEELSLQQVGHNVLQRLASKAEQANVTLQFKEGAAEDFHILGIPSLVEEIFTNLVDNAIKYNRPGGSVSLSFVEKANKYAVIVADTGMGIAAEEQAHIFERFYRVDRSRNKGVDGTGLGLSIVKHGVQFHRGTIRVRSQMGQGTQFIVKFPKVRM